MGRPRCRRWVADLVGQLHVAGEELLLSLGTIDARQMKDEIRLTKTRGHGFPAIVSVEAEHVVLRIATQPCRQVAPQETI